jgi:hypothetical protein
MGKKTRIRNEMKCSNGGNKKIKERRWTRQGKETF